MELTNEQLIREKALQLALQGRLPGSIDSNELEGILQVAKGFEDYLKGEKANP